MRKYRIFLYMFLGFSIALLQFALLSYCKSQIPDTIRVKAGTSEEINLGIPAFGTITANRTNTPQKHVDCNAPLRIVAGNYLDSYKMELKLFGVIPLKNVDIEVIEETLLTPVGSPIGIYVKTQGVLVIDTGSFQAADGNLTCPCEYKLQAGDYLTAIDGIAVTNKKQVKNYVENSKGKEIIFQINRQQDVFQVKVTPSLDENMVYKLGVWLRDSAQGIGTMTYIDTNNHFGALGHGINDMDTGKLLTLGNGLLYQTQVLSIEKGTRGKPGELTGIIEYQPDKVAGIITNNTSEGIFGITTQSSSDSFVSLTPIPILLKKDAKTGPAKIYCNINGKPKYYDIQVTRLMPGDSNINRQISFIVTDESLLKLTGGIVQGMSGSPIIMDGKFLGAVTHVLVDNPKKGYGIFIEDMLINTQ